MARTLASSGPATAAALLVCPDDDVNNTFKDFGSSAATIALNSGSENARSITWNGHTVISKYAAAQVSPLYDVTQSAGFLSDPCTILALIYNQSGAVPIHRSIMSSNIARCPFFQADSAGTGKIALYRALGDSTGNILSGTVPGASTSYLIAMTIVSGAQEVYYSADPTVAISATDNTATSVTTYGDSSGRLQAIGYEIGIGTGWPGEIVLVGMFNRKLTTTELTNINQNPYGTLFKSGVGFFHSAGMSGGMHEMSGGMG